MSARFWTDERRAALVRFERLELTMVEQAERLGCTRQSVESARSRFGIADQSRSSARAMRRRPVKPETREKIAAHARAQMADPGSGMRERLARGVAMMRSGEICDRRRGFAIPAERRDEYRRLVYGLGYSATEAASILGFLPEDMEVRPRAERRYRLTPSRLRRINTPEGVVAAVAREAGVAADAITGPADERALVSVRHRAVRTLRERFPRLSASAIGRLMGRDHTTILFVLKEASPS